MKTGFEKSISSSDSGVENSNIFARLKQAVEAFLAQLEQMIAQRGRARMLPYREQRIPARSLRQFEQARGGFIYRVAPYARTACRAKCLTRAREEQTQKIVTLGRSRDRRARIPAGIFLPDGNRRRDPIDLIHRRLFHALEKLPGVRRQRFHVAALALGVDGIESQR